MVDQPEQYHSVLNRIMQNELAGVVRYTHYSLMVRRHRSLGSALLARNSPRSPAGSRPEPAADRRLLQEPGV